MKLLHITDLHFNHQIFNWIWAQRKQYDLICISGDFLSSQKEPEITKEVQIEWVTVWLEKLDIPTFICSGNHDAISAPEQSIEELFSGYDEIDDFYADDGFNNVQSDEDYSWLNKIKNKHVFSDFSKTTFGAYKIGCVPYHAEDLSYFHDCDIILHHVPPANSDQSKSNGIDYGCSKLKTYIDKNLLSAKYILSGHVHRPKVTKSKCNGVWIVNPGSGNLKKPKYEVIDL